MKTVKDLQDFINSGDVYSFLETYLKIVEDNGSLELPAELNMDTLASQWQDILPLSCQQATSEFYDQLAIIWFELVNSYQETTEDKTFNISSLLMLLHRNYLKENKFDSFAIRQGYVLKKDTKQNQAIYNITYDFSEKKLQSALSSNNPKEFLIEYCKLSLTGDVSLPKTSLEEKILQEFSSILLSRYNKTTKSFLNKLTKLYFNLVNRFGLPMTNDILTKYIQYMITKKINL